MDNVMFEQKQIFLQNDFCIVLKFPGSMFDLFIFIKTSGILLNIYMMKISDQSFILPVAR